MSLVLYKPDVAQLSRTLATLQHACAAIASGPNGCRTRIVLIDNGGSPDLSATAGELEQAGFACTVIGGHGNVGYGRGHNLALGHIASRYHLVLNPDVELDADALALALQFLDSHPEVGLLTPWIGDESGAAQFLCRRHPSVLDLFVRGFLPVSLRKPFQRRLAHYEMRDQVGERDIVWDPPIVSGCFMLFRTEILERLGGFDPRYFLYFEDYDLSLRTHEIARVAYVPTVRILHHGGGAARKGWTHVKLFGASAFKFFNRFGWKWL